MKKASLLAITGLFPFVVFSQPSDLLNNFLNETKQASGAFEQNTNEAGGHEKEYCRRIVVTNGSRTIEITTVGRTGKILTK